MQKSPRLSITQQKTLQRMSMSQAFKNERLFEQNSTHELNKARHQNGQWSLPVITVPNQP